MRERLGNAGQALILGSRRRGRRARWRWRSASTAPTCAARSPRRRPSARALEAALLNAHERPRRATTRPASRSRARRPGRRSRPAATASRSRRRCAATPATAARWLLVREFRPPTKLSRPGADATVANVAARRRRPLARQGRRGAARRPARHLPVAHARRPRLGRARRSPATSRSAPRSRPRSRRASGACSRPSYRAQVGAAPEAALASDLAALTAAARAQRTAEVATLVHSLSERLDAFRAAPLSQHEQLRRASQVRTFTPLVSVEYGRGVTNGRVLRDFEIQEAITFQSGALSAFHDIEPMLLKRNAGRGARHRELARAARHRSRGRLERQARRRPRRARGPHEGDHVGHRRRSSRRPG